MCENKYAKKVIAETLAAPLYSVGEIVQIRKTAKVNGTTPVEYKNMTATVIEVGHLPVISAAKGAKQYKILPFGEKNAVSIEERYIKKYRKKA